MANQEAVDIAKKIKDPQKAAKQLATEALNRDSKDDISCVVVRFKGWKRERTDMHTYPKFSGYTYIQSTYQDAIPYSTCKNPSSVWNFFFKIGFASFTFICKKKI
jgi:serine/threonine protein phosphatase PrpC